MACATELFPPQKEHLTLLLFGLLVVSIIQVRRMVKDIAAVVAAASTHRGIGYKGELVSTKSWHVAYLDQLKIF